MRRLLLAVSVTFGLAWLPTGAAQRAVVAPAAPSAPASVGHAAPVYAGPSHVAPAIGAHAPSIRANARPAARPGIRASAPSGSAKAPLRSAAPSTHPRISWNSSSTPSGNTATDSNGVRVIVHSNGPYLPTYPPEVPNAPVLLPGDIFSGNSCYAPALCNATPGLGFDYDHFFKTHPNWGGQILTAGVVVPFGGQGGLYTPVPYYFPGYYSGPAPEEGEQGPAPSENANNNGPNGEQNYNHNQQMVPQQGAPPAAQNYYAPSEPVYEYVFVKRDGTKIFAVAYSLTKDKLSYVTKEGLRRTLSLDALDFDATRKSNEERGNTVTLPSAPAAAMAMAS